MSGTEALIPQEAVEAALDVYEADRDLPSRLWMASALRAALAATQRAAAEERIQELERALEDMLGQCERCRSARAVLEKRKQISAAGAGAEQCGDLGGIGGFECDRPKGHAGRHVVERKP
jgi:hypothetical protein